MSSCSGWCHGRIRGVLFGMLCAIVLVSCACPPAAAYTFSGHVYLGKTWEDVRPLEEMTIQLWISKNDIVSDRSPNEDGWHLIAEERSSWNGHYSVFLPDADAKKYEYYLLILIFPDQYNPNGVGGTVGLKAGSDWVVYSLPLPQGGINNLDFLLVDKDRPVADFTASPTSGTGSLTVHFTDLSQNNPFFWEWDLNGDGKTESNEQHPTFTYSKPGLYTVRLRVTNSAGESQEIKQDYIQVRQSPLPYPFILAVLLIGGFVSRRMWKDHIHREKCRQSTKHIDTPGIEIRGGMRMEKHCEFEIPHVGIEIRGGIANTVQAGGQIHGEN